MAWHAPRSTPHSHDGHSSHSSPAAPAAAVALPPGHAKAMGRTRRRAQRGGGTAAQVTPS